VYVKDVSPSLIILTTNCCQLDYITKKKKKVVCRTATRVAVGLQCKTAATASRCPPLQESVRNLDTDVIELNWRNFGVSAYKEEGSFASSSLR
jgi:hypothetical protein